MRQLPDHTVTGGALFPTAATPRISLDDPTRQDRPIGIKSLAGHLQPELVQTGERRQVRGREGSVRHVEVFQMAGVGTSILGRPRPLPTDRRADRPYTLICEEPVKVLRRVDSA
jgi:hypothetical protein